MLLEINQLIDSDNEIFRKIGWLLYDNENGLSKDKVEELSKYIHILTGIENTSEKELEDAYEEGYNEGYRDARMEYDWEIID